MIVCVVIFFCTILNDFDCIHKKNDHLWRIFFPTHQQLLKWTFKWEQILFFLFWTFCHDLRLHDGSHSNMWNCDVFFISSLLSIPEQLVFLTSFFYDAIVFGSMWVILRFHQNRLIHSWFLINRPTALAEDWKKDDSEKTGKHRDRENEKEWSRTKIEKYRLYYCLLLSNNK